MCRLWKFPITAFGPLLVAFTCPGQLLQNPTSTHDSGAGRRDAQATRLFQEGAQAFAKGDLGAAHQTFARLVQLAPEIAAAHAAFGAVLLAESQTSQALVELTEARRLDPHDSQNTINLGLAEIRAGRSHEALKAYHDLPLETQRSLPADEALAFATALADSGQTQEAEQELKTVLENAPQTAVLMDALGSVQARRFDLNDARKSFLTALTLDRNYAPAHAHLGSLLLIQGDPTTAVSELKEAVRLGDLSLPTQVELGRSLSASGADTDAVAVLKKTHAEYPKSIEATYALALTLQAAGEAEQAVLLFADVTRAQPENVSALTNEGLALVQTGKSREALERYRRAAALKPPDATLHQDMGVAYLQTNDIDHALLEFQAGLGQEPQNAQLHYDLGLALKLKDDLVQAGLELEKAESLNGQLPDPPYTLGVIRMQQGNAQAAVEQFERAVHLRPKNGDAWALLGSVRKDEGDLPGAATALQSAIALQPDQPSPHITLASILVAQGRPQDALAERKRAADLSRAAMGKQRAGFALQSGRALLGKGDYAGAVLQFKDAIGAEPDLRDAHLLLADALEKQGRPADALRERQLAEHLPAPH